MNSSWKDLNVARGTLPEQMLVTRKAAMATAHIEMDGGPHAEATGNENWDKPKPPVQLIHPKSLAGRNL